MVKWILFFCLSGGAWAKEDISIFDVRKSLAMSEQAVQFQDFYVSKGSGAGLRPGMIITVKRRVPMYDSLRNRNAGDLLVPVGRIKIIHVENDLSVGRLFQEFSRADLPILEDNFIMVGDTVDLASATTESKLKPSKPASAEKSSAAHEEAPQLETSAPQAKLDTEQLKVDFSEKPTHNDTAPQGPIAGPVMQ